MMHIHLHKLRFRGFHGLYEEEKVLGNDYELDLAVGFEPQAFVITDIDQTLNYVTLFELVKKRMLVPTPLLETIVTEIADQIRSDHATVSKISISIKKLYPPINNFEGTVGVSFEWNK
jgi:7,8-dihydroneopterin aldolase/epimerase/oxygenase